MPGPRSSPADAQRARRLAATLVALEARFGPGLIRWLSARPARDPAERVVPSGSVGLDRATGLGGFPRGHLTEILGPESSGKTTLLHAALAATQRAGGLAALVDAEDGADGASLAAAGCDLDTLLIVKPTSARDALLMAIILARCSGLDLLGFASLDALRDLPGGTGRETPPHLEALATAGLLTRGLRVLTTALRDSPTAVVATNLALPDVPDALPDRSTGGLALRHFAALRIAVRPLAPLADTDGGLRVRLTVVKHKLGVGGGWTAVDLVPGWGLDRAEELARLGLAAGLLVPGPYGIAYAGTPLGGTPAAVRRRLEGDPALAAALRAALLTHPASSRVA
jgi:recombination protein RecA